MNYAARGYESICTGGNCTGMYHKLPDGGLHILITDSDNSAPTDWHAPVCAGLYGENGLWLAKMEAHDSDEIFRKIASGEWECAS